MSWWRGPFGVTLRRCLRSAGPLTAAAAALAVFGEWVGALPQVAEERAAASSTPWLTLPLFVAAVASCVVAAQTWPTFSLRRQGADAVRRVARGPLGGRGHVVLGAAAAQLLLTVPLLLTLPAWFGVDRDAYIHSAAEPPEAPILDRPGAQVVFAATAPIRARAVWLRPRASLPTGPAPTRLRLTTKDRELASTPIEFVESMELIRVPIDAQVIEAVEITQTSGDVPLLFGPGSVVFVGADALPRWQNSLALSLLLCAPSLLTLAVGALLGLTAGWPTVAAGIGALQFVQWIGGAGPVDEALLAFARGQWLL